MWNKRKKAELEARIRVAQEAADEARSIRELETRQEERASLWDVVVERRNHDNLGAELEISFTRRERT